ncbi:ankyrin repeat domain-containing protein [Blastopirellula sp. JC732]|uniref:Ankyrin repeat domain-containing protein n=1 Tax=Blastopirellula sediminis TaxID=2894196 RepID=A0A9X1MNM6_9BACT|nr:ankyrin repeat domain-containing protein [Blastopirellula sediminis]MCC9628789.1 ankyrin repeat domain-containing protein [Blastopirellula sediminis]
MATSENQRQLDKWLEAEGYPTDDLEATRENETTALMRAARLGRADVIQDLLERGADPNRLNADKNPALWFACFSSSLKSIDLLIDAGADLDTQNVNGATSLIYAASAGKTDVVRRLLERGASTAPETLDGYTALDSAASPPVLKLLRTAVASAAEKENAPS